MIDRLQCWQIRSCDDDHDVVPNGQQKVRRVSAPMQRSTTATGPCAGRGPGHDDVSFPPAAGTAWGRWEPCFFWFTLIWWQPVFLCVHHWSLLVSATYRQPVAEPGFLWSLSETQRNTKDLFDMALAPPKMALARGVAFSVELKINHLVKTTPVTIL
jgi:hypothetical protein